MEFRLNLNNNIKVSMCLKSCDRPGMNYFVYKD